MLISLKSWLLSHRPVLLQISQVNKNIRQELQNWEKEATFEDVKLLSKEQLRGYLDTEWIRSKELDEKLAKLTVSLAVSLTVGGFVSKAIADNLSNQALKNTVVFLFFLSMLYFLVGARIGFSGLEPKPRYGYGATYLRLTSKKSIVSKRSMIEAACAFQAMNLIRANEAYAATHHIRRGILCFGIAMTLSLIPEQLLPFEEFSFSKFSQ